MKKAGFLICVLFLIFPKKSFAENIITGDASSYSNVISNVSGNGSVTTHIETTVNGKTDVENSNQPGRIDVENNNGNVTVIKSPQSSITVSSTLISTSTPHIIKNINNKKNNFISNFFGKVKNFIIRIFNDL